LERFKIYKQFGVFILILALQLQSFQKGLIISDYYINTAAYAANCENKAKVELHCNGKCQMMKKLRQEDEKDQQNPQRKVENNRETFLFIEELFCLNTPPSQDIEQSFSLFLVQETIDRPHTAFHPPGA